MSRPSASGGSGVRGRRARWLRRAVWLVGGTMAYNVLEAGVALWAGWRAGSVALVGFGLDSGIELGAAAVVLWRLRVEAVGGEPERVARTEDRVHRYVGSSLLFLSAYVVGYAAWSLVGGHPPSESWLGIVLAALSLVLMPLISVGKLRAAQVLGSAALRAEALETLACAYLSFCLLLGLVLNALLGLWWADPAAALLMVPWLVREGLEGLEGEDGDE